MTKQRSYGYTLIELLIVMVVMSIISLVLANFITTWLQSSSQAQARAFLLGNAESAVGKVTNDILLSGSVDLTNRWSDANGPGGNPFGWQSNSTTLILAKVATNSGNNPIFLDSSNYITQKDDIIYFISGKTLYRRVLKSTSTNDAAVTTCPQSDATISCPVDNTVVTNVTSWSLVYYDANDNIVSPANARSVQVSITLSSGYGSQPFSESYTTRMVFRND